MRERADLILGVKKRGGGDSDFQALFAKCWPNQWTRYRWTVCETIVTFLRAAVCANPNRLRAESGCDGSN